MSAWIGMALAATLGWNGTNGLDPADILLLRNPGGIEVHPDAGDFLAWLNDDPTEREARAEVVQYFVACAFDRKTIIHLYPWTWRGDLGLAQEALESMLNPKLEPKDRRAVWSSDAGKWVSACLMAHANMKGLHQYISIRGNPPGAAARKALKPTPGERWTMSSPEGVFLASLFDDPRPPKCHPLRNSFTFSLNLPRRYDGSWWPPNFSLGRTLDYDSETAVDCTPSSPAGGTAGTVSASTLPSVPPVQTRVARRLGAFHEQSEELFEKATPLTATDPVYKAKGICVDATPKVAKCGDEGAVKLRPLFVLSPRLVNLEYFEPSRTIEARAKFEGAVVADGDKSVAMGAFNEVRPGETPGDPTRTDPPRRLVNLSQWPVQATLHFAPKDPQHLKVQVTKEKYTAIIRYSSAKTTRALVRLSTGEPDRWLDVGEVWPSTGGKDERWMQVYPVVPFLEGGGSPALAVEIHARTGAAPPELDVAGFVPGPPWCHDGDKPFMGVCEGAQAPKLRSLSVSSRRPR